MGCTIDRVELRQLSYFVAVAEELHFGRAAERLYISGPSLSQQISNLERELGTQLLVRDRRHVDLTPAGRRFLTDAREVLASATRAFDRARKGSGDLPLRLGYVKEFCVIAGSKALTTVGRSVEEKRSRAPRHC